MTLLLTVCLAMGVFITVAEPDLTVLANQVSAVINPTLLIFTVGAGVGIFLLLSVVKILTKKPLPMILMFFYMLLFALTVLVVVHENNDFLAMAFDSGGVTTGPITVPFIMALGVGIAATIGGKNVSENSFGLVAMCSIGPILAVMLLGVFAKGDITYSAPVYSMDSNGISDIILHTLFDRSCQRPLTSTFILPFAIGACFILQGEGKIMSDAFGIVSMVAMTPLITIQLLGFKAVISRKVRHNIAMKRILSSDDEQIINFM